jgi:ribonuclease T2
LHIHFAVPLKMASSFAGQLLTFSALMSSASAGTFINFAAEGPKSCPADSPLSCQNTTTVEDLCCFNAPGGQLLLTNFWDADPAVGPENSWTIHGLWPDHCMSIVLKQFMF